MIDYLAIIGDSSDNIQALEELMQSYTSLHSSLVQSNLFIKTWIKLINPVRKKA